MKVDPAKFHEIKTIQKLFYGVTRPQMVLSPKVSLLLLRFLQFCEKSSGNQDKNVNKNQRGLANTSNAYCC